MPLQSTTSLPPEETASLSYREATPVPANAEQTERMEAPPVLAAPPETRRRFRLGFALNNFPEEVFEIKGKWLLLVLSAMLGLGVVTNLAVNEGRKALTPLLTQTEERWQTRNDTLESLLAEWCLDGSVELANSPFLPSRFGKVRRAEYQLDRPFREVCEVYARRVGYKEGEIAVSGAVITKDQKTVQTDALSQGLRLGQSDLNGHDYGTLTAGDGQPRLAIFEIGSARHLITITLVPQQNLGKPSTLISIRIVEK